VSRRPSPPSTARRKDEHRRDRQEAAAYVVSLNLKRRYLDESQLAYMASKIENKMQICRLIARPLPTLRTACAA